VRAPVGSASGRPGGGGARNAKNLTAEERLLRSRMAAYRLPATHDPRETTTTRKARAAFASRFEREVRPRWDALTD
jgi:hypothetical protein